MRTLRWIPLVLMVAASFLAGAVTPPDHLPAVFSGLVPPGYTLVSPGFKRSVAGEYRPHQGDPGASVVLEPVTDFIPTHLTPQCVVTYVTAAAMNDPTIPHLALQITNCWIPTPTRIAP